VPASGSPSGRPDSPGIPGMPRALFTAGTVNLTMPLDTWLGLPDASGNVDRFGPKDADDSSAIADVFSARSRTR